MISTTLAHQQPPTPTQGSPQKDPHPAQTPLSRAPGQDLFSNAAAALFAQQVVLQSQLQYAALLSNLRVGQLSPSQYYQALLSNLALASPKSASSPSTTRKRPEPEVVDDSASEATKEPEGSPTKRKYKTPSSPTKRHFNKNGQDDETQSPVSGMFIKSADSVPPPELLQAAADSRVGIEPLRLPVKNCNGRRRRKTEEWMGAGEEEEEEEYEIFQVTDEAKRKFALIQNVIGDYVCRLCKVGFALKGCAREGGKEGEGEWLEKGWGQGWLPREREGGREGSCRS